MKGEEKDPSKLNLYLFPPPTHIPLYPASLPVRNLVWWVWFHYFCFDFGLLAMDSFSNASVSSSPQQNCHLEWSPTAPAMEQEGDGALSLEWLSIFMEDCLSGTTAFSIPQNQASPTNNPPPPNTKPSSNHMNKFPTKTKPKRRKITLLEEEIIPLLPQTYWLAESELILPKKDSEEEEKANNTEEVQGQPRRCAHCLSQKTPQWRAGPLGPKTLCNACGVRFKSGRLLPEYRPFKHVAEA